jgi:hypothetical protein
VTTQEAKNLVNSLLDANILLIKALRAIEGVEMMDTKGNMDKVAATNSYVEQALKCLEGTDILKHI